ncbi:MAG: tetratricopeptide repeat protein [Spirochaetaceae bacterium]|jgi:tetratricopeptide (TPR) repeat protein|nr:tetratricopeptide repeat protein [Spirochaetaceae bacterium]
MNRHTWSYGSFGVIALVIMLSCASSPRQAGTIPAQEPALSGEAPVPVVQAEKEIPFRDALLARILDCLGAGDFDGALALFDEFPEEDAKTAEIRLLKTSVYVSAGRVSEGRDAANGVIADEPQNPDAFYALFMVEAAAGNKQAMRKAVDTALKIDKDHLPSLNALGTIHARNDSWALAVTQFDKVLAIDPANLAALTGKAEVFRFQGLSAEAMPLANQAVALHPDKMQGYVIRGQLLRGSGEMGPALADFVSAEQLAPRDYWVCYDKGRTLLSLGRPDEAFAAFERAITLDGTQFVAYIYSAGILADRGDYAKAEARYVEAVKRNPDYFYAYEGLGMLKMKNKEYAAARDAFLAAYAKAPSENGYAVLAALNALRVQKLFEVKPFLESAMRLAKRDTLDYAILRMLNDFNGDANVARQIDAEKDTFLKGKSAFYLAEFYDICNKAALANAYYEKCRETGRRDTVEWRLNQWKMEERDLLVQASPPAGKVSVEH